MFEKWIIILCCICLLWKKRITYVFKKYIINLIRYNKADVKIKKHDFGIFCPYFFLPKKVLCCIFLTQQLNLQNLNYEQICTFFIVARAQKKMYIHKSKHFHWAAAYFRHFLCKISALHLMTRVAGGLLVKTPKNFCWSFSFFWHDNFTHSQKLPIGARSSAP